MILLKVDQCMDRLQELQFTVAGGTKLVSGVNLSPRSTRTYLRTSLRCKQESIRYILPFAFNAFSLSLPSQRALFNLEFRRKDCSFVLN